ncbi:MAG: CDP-alcohol phosphatidyltransferase family protein [Actinobacteria bacterium]|nr:CDP-alcohol phosphatidyltransferase family protein [Actinomycetota bacterium]
MIEEDGEVSTRVLTVPNLISFARLGLIPIFFWLFVTRTNDALAFALLVLVGSTDWVDGFVARRTGQVSVLGKVLDPVADRVAIVAILLAFLFRGTIPIAVAWVILARDALVALTFPILEARGYPRIPVNFVGKAGTAAIYFGVGTAAASLVLQNPLISVAAIVLLWIGAGLYWVAGILYVVEIRKLVRARAAV